MKRTKKKGFSLKNFFHSIQFKLTFTKYQYFYSLKLTFFTYIFNSSGIDGNPTVFYRLMPGSTAQTNKFHTFYLQQRPDNGDTWADIKVNHPLDYESIKEYNLTIRVEVRIKGLYIYLFKRTHTQRDTEIDRQR